MTGTVDSCDDRADQGGAAARDEHVDEAAGAHQLPYGLAALARHELDGVGGQAGAADGVAQDPYEGGVGLVRGGRAAQQDRVAGLQAEGGGVDGDVGAGLVDDADDAERHADLAQVDAVREGRAADDLADRVGQRHHVPHVGGDRADPLGGEGQPVDDGLAGAGLTGLGDVLGVGLDDLARTDLQRVRDREQRVVLRGPRERREVGGGALGAVGGLGDRGHRVVRRERGHSPQGSAPAQRCSAVVPHRETGPEMTAESGCPVV